MSHRTAEETLSMKQALQAYWHGMTPKKVQMPDPTNPARKLWFAPPPEAHDNPDWCPVCEDRGWVTIRREAQACPAACKASKALQDERKRKLYEGARMPAEYQGLTLDTFRAAIRADETLWTGKALAYYATEAFIADPAHYVDLKAVVDKAGKATAPIVQDWRNWLVFYGVHGVGKTGFAAAIVNAAVQDGEAVRYIRAQDFIAAVQSRYGLDKDAPMPRDGFGDLSAEGVIESVREAPLLVLDEFDMPDAKRENKQAIMENVIRYRHGEALPTIITTNLETLDAMEDRWGVTTVSVIGQRAHRIPVGGLVMRPTPQEVSL